MLSINKKAVRSECNNTLTKADQHAKSTVSQRCFSSERRTAENSQYAFVMPNTGRNEKACVSLATIFFDDCSCAAC